MRPCTALNPCACFRKYAGVFDEQPMPDSLRHPVRRDVELEEGEDDGGRDRVVAAAAHSVDMLPS
jgi:hypothetical protein